MMDTNNRISSAASPYDGTTPRSQGNNAVDGPSDFERLLRRQRIQQQSRQIQQQSPPLDASPPGILFSKHAQQRLDKRQIQLAPEQSQRLEQAVASAAGKGARQSLVFLDGIAFIVNVEDRRVVTALNVEPGSAHSVFTNIDSAVLA